LAFQFWQLPDFGNSRCLRGEICSSALAEKLPRVDNLYTFKTGEDQLPKYVIEREIPVREA